MQFYVHTSAKVEVMWSMRFVCPSFCYSVWSVTAEVINWFRWNLGVMIGPAIQKNWLTFDGNPVQDTDYGSFSTFLTIAE